MTLQGVWLTDTSQHHDNSQNDTLGIDPSLSYMTANYPHTRHQLLSFPVDIQVACYMFHSHCICDLYFTGSFSP